MLSSKPEERHSKKRKDKNIGKKKSKPATPEGKQKYKRK